MSAWKNILAFLLCVAILVPMLAACGNGDTSPTPETDTGTEESAVTDAEGTELPTDVPESSEDTESVTPMPEATAPSVNEPDGTESEPDGTESEPDGTESEPDGTESEPDGTESEPDGTESEPDGTESEPDGTESESDVAESESVGAESSEASSQTETEEEPIPDEEPPHAPSRGLKYVLLEDGTYAVDGIGSCRDDVVVIPAEYEGAAVTVIAKRAFLHCNEIERIFLPDTIVRIEEDAFLNCDAPLEVENGISYVGKWVVGCEGNVVNAVLRKNTVGIACEAFLKCWRLTSVDLPAGVRYIGERAFQECGTLERIVIPEGVAVIESGLFYQCGSLQSVTVCGNVTAIGRRAFYDCGALKQLSIPATFTSIGDYAFYGCKKIERFPIPDGVVEIGSYAFYNCTLLKEVTLPASLRILGSHAFYNTKAIEVEGSIHYVDRWVVNSYRQAEHVTLREDTVGIAAYSFGLSSGDAAIFSELVIPESVRSICDHAFLECTSLVEISLPSRMDYLGDYAFGLCNKLTSIILPEGIDSIPVGAFVDCSALTSITVPSSVLRIDENAFTGCLALTEVYFEENDKIESIGAGAFRGCTLLSCIELPSSVISIGGSAFYNCAALGSLAIPSGVESIGELAFAGCTALSSVTISADEISIGESAFMDCIGLTAATISADVITVGEYVFKNCTALETVTLTGELETIPVGMFSTCTALTTVTLPESTSVLDTAAFYCCTSLVTVTLPPQLTYIAERVFYGCTGLVSVSIPETVRFVRAGAFAGCTSLQSLVFEGDSQIEAVANSILTDCSSLVAYSGPFVTSISKTVQRVVITDKIPQKAFYMYRNLTSVTLCEGVTSIAQLAFCGCVSLTEVILPESLTYIGSSAFYDCDGAMQKEDNVIYVGKWVVDVEKGVKSVTLRADTVGIAKGGLASSYDLESVTLPNSLRHICEEAFYYCASLTSITIPKGVEHIGASAFAKCSELTEVVIPDGVRVIGAHAFQNCKKLESVTLPQDGLFMDQSAFDGCTSLLKTENGVIYVGRWVFGCTADATDIALRADTVGIMQKAFYENSTLTNVTLPSGLQTIGASAFEGCKRLTRIEIPEGVTVIGDRAFARCVSLVEATLPSSVRSIGGDLFDSCSALASVTLAEGIPLIGSSTFSSCDALASITIPASVTSIGVHAFSDCDALSQVIFSEGSQLTDIESYAFYDCDALTSIALPESVVRIGNYAFEECTRLTHIEISKDSQLTEIGNSAFSDCQNLTTFTFPERLVSIGGSAFSGCTRLVLVYDFSDAIDVDSVGCDYVLEIIKTEEATENIWTDANGYRFYENGDVCYLLGYSGTETALTLPDSCHGKSYEIYWYAFSGVSLTEVTIPARVTRIGEYAFAGCRLLTRVVLEKNNQLTHIDSYAFANCYFLHAFPFENADQLTWIGEYAFYHSGLASVTVPACVTYIGSEAFGYCYELMSVTLEENSQLRVLERGAFEDCTALVSVSLAASDRLIKIKNHAFSNCKALVSIYLPDSLTRIEDYAFSTYDSLKEVYYSGTREEWRKVDKGSYNQDLTDASVYCLEDCTHENVREELVSTVYLNLIKNGDLHDGYRVYNRRCNGCNLAMDVIRVPFTGEAHSLNRKGYCDCGYINTEGYEAWETVNGTEEKAIVYQTPESNENYGYIHPNESVTVLGESCGRYLIEYVLDGSTDKKQGYVAIHSLKDAEAGYALYVDSAYFIEARSKYMVVEVGTEYPILFRNTRTQELLAYGAEHFSCRSEDESIAQISKDGMLRIREIGETHVYLLYDGEVIDSVAVYGCVGETRLTNYSASSDSELFRKGFAPNCRLKVFNYKSVFVRDEGNENGGYFKVTFDVYNDVPTIFCVGSFDRNGVLQEQVLIEGYSANMVQEMVSSFVHIGDLLNGKLLRGESVTYQTLTPVELEVPMGGYVDFLSMAHSDYMVYANALSGIVVSAMETADQWTEIIMIKSGDLKFDKLKFAQAIVESICGENPGMTPQKVVSRVIEILVNKTSNAAVVTDLMAFLGDNGVTMKQLFETLADCALGSLESIRDGAIETVFEGALKTVPPAALIKKVTDAFVASLQYTIVLKDIASMAVNTDDFMVIVYPTTVE